MIDPDDKYHFSKDDILNLDHLPSANTGYGVRVASPHVLRRLHRASRKALVIVTSITLVFTILAYILLKVGLSGEFLTNRLQQAIQNQLGSAAQIDLKDSRLSLDNDFHIAFEAQGIHFAQIDSALEIKKIGTVKLGLSTLALLEGRLVVQQIEIENAVFDIPPGNNRSIFSGIPLDSRGHPDIEAFANALFSTLDQALNFYNISPTPSILLKNVSFQLPNGGATSTLKITELRVKDRAQRLLLKSKIVWRDAPIDVVAELDYTPDRKADFFNLNLHNFPVRLGADDDETALSPTGQVNNMFFRLKGKLDLGFSGKRNATSDGDRLHLSINLHSGLIDLGLVSGIATNTSLQVSGSSHSQDIIVEPSIIALGGLKLPMKGKINLHDSVENQDQQNVYPFEFTTDQAISAPSDSPSRPLHFGFTVAGNFNETQLVFDRISIETNDAQISGVGGLKFGEGSPEIKFALNVPQLNVDDAKQLWPVNISVGARRWVLAHIFGGVLHEGQIMIDFPSGHFKPDAPPPATTGKEFKLSANAVGVRSDLVGELPALRDGKGNITVEGTTTTITLDKATAYMVNNHQLVATKGILTIPWGPQRPVYAELNIAISGDAPSAGTFISYAPIGAATKLPFTPADVVGDIDAKLHLKFPVTFDEPRGKVTFETAIRFKDLSITKPVAGIILKQANGVVDVSEQGAHVNAQGLVNDLPADIELVDPFGNTSIIKSQKITLHLDDKVREKNFPFLNDYLSGPVTVEIGADANGKRHLSADLTAANIAIPWVGWKKSKDMVAKAEFDIPSDLSKLDKFDIDNIAVSGSNLNVTGALSLENKQLKSLILNNANLNRNDQLSIKVQRANSGYNITTTGSSFDARDLISILGQSTLPVSNKVPIGLTATFASVTGYHDEKLKNVHVSIETTKSNGTQFILTATTANKARVNVSVVNQKDSQVVNVQTRDGGAFLRFMNYYDKIYGGMLSARLSAQNGRALNGPIVMHNFAIINEPKLASFVSTRTNGRSLNDTVKGKINVSEVDFDRAYAQIEKGDNYMVVDKGILRGPSVGATFQGVVYDSAGNTSITGTFMPAYSLNSLFSQVPIIGGVLGNGRDRGLIGITFKVEGNAKSPHVSINPISLIAPGIFRSIFEYQ